MDTVGDQENQLDASTDLIIDEGNLQKEDSDDENGDDFQEMEGIDVTAFFNIEQEGGPGVYGSLNYDSYSIGQLPSDDIKEEPSDQDWPTPQYSNETDLTELPATADESCSSFDGIVQVKEESEGENAMLQYKGESKNSEGQSSQIDRVYIVPDTVHSVSSVTMAYTQPNMTTAPTQSFVAMVSSAPSLSEPVPSTQPPYMIVGTTLASTSHSMIMRPTCTLPSTSPSTLPCTLPYVAMPSTIHRMLPSVTMPSTLPRTLPAVAMPSTLPRTLPSVPMLSTLPRTLPAMAMSSTLPRTLPAMAMPSTLPRTLPAVAIPSTLPCTLPAVAMSSTAKSSTLPRTLPSQAMPSTLPCSLAPPSAILRSTMPSVMTAPTLPTMTAVSSGPLTKASTETVASLEPNTANAPLVPLVNRAPQIQYVRMPSILPPVSSTSPTFYMTSSIPNTSTAISGTQHLSGTNNLTSIPIIMTSQSHPSMGHFKLVPLFQTKGQGGLVNCGSQQLKMCASPVDSVQTAGAQSNSSIAGNSITDSGILQPIGKVASTGYITNFGSTPVGQAVGVTSEQVIVSKKDAVSVNASTLDRNQGADNSVINQAKTQEQGATHNRNTSKEELTSKNPFHFTTLETPEAFLTPDFNVTITKPVGMVQTTLTQSVPGVQMSAGGLPVSSCDAVDPTVYLKDTLSQIRKTLQLGDNATLTVRIEDSGVSNNSSGSDVKARSLFQEMPAAPPVAEVNTDQSIAAKNVIETSVNIGNSFGPSAISVPADLPPSTRAQVSQPPKPEAVSSQVRTRKSKDKLRALFIDDSVVAEEPPSKRQKQETEEAAPPIDHQLRQKGSVKSSRTPMHANSSIKTRLPKCNLTPTPPNMINIPLMPDDTGGRIQPNPLGPATEVAEKINKSFQEFFQENVQESAQAKQSQETVSKNTSTAASASELLRLGYVRTITKNLGMSVNGSEDSMCMNTQSVPRSQVLLVHHSVDHDTDSAILCCCSHCDFWCVSATELCTHWHVFTRHSLTQCYVCQKRLTNQEDLNLHFSEVHPDVAKKHKPGTSYSYTTKPLGPLTRLRTVIRFGNNTKVPQLLVNHQSSCCRLLLYICVACGYKHPEYEITRLHAFDHLKQKFTELGLSPSERVYFENLLLPEEEGAKYILPESVVVDIDSGIAPVEYAVHVYYKEPESRKTENDPTHDVPKAVACNENDILVEKNEHLGLKEMFNLEAGPWDVYVDALVIREISVPEETLSQDVDLALNQITDRGSSFPAIKNGCLHLLVDWKTKTITTMQDTLPVSKEEAGRCYLFLCNLCSFLCCSQQETCILNHMRSSHYWYVDDCTTKAGNLNVENIEEAMENGKAHHIFGKMMNSSAFFNKMRIENRKLKLYICDACNFFHPVLTNVQNHVLRVHSHAAKKQWKKYAVSCKLCNFVYYYRDKLAKHMYYKHAGCDMKNHSKEWNTSSDGTMFGIVVSEFLIKCTWILDPVSTGSQETVPVVCLRDVRLRSHQVFNYGNYVLPRLLAEIKLVTFDDCYTYCMLIRTPGSHLATQEPIDMRDARKMQAVKGSTRIEGSNSLKSKSKEIALNKDGQKATSSEPDEDIHVAKVSHSSKEPKKIATWQTQSRAGFPLDQACLVSPEDSAEGEDITDGPSEVYKAVDDDRYPEGLTMLCPHLGVNCKNSSIVLMPPVRRPGRKEQIEMCYIFTCKICQFWCVGQSKTCVMEHVRESHIRHHCKFCAITFPSYLDLEDHMELTHSHKQERNDQLAKNTAQYIHSCVDMRSFGTLPKRYSLHRCTECNAVFPSLLLVDYHVLSVHLGQRDMWACPLCESAFANEVVLRNHLLNKHPYTRDNANMSQLLKASPSLVAKLTKTHSLWVHSANFDFSWQFEEVAPPSTVRPKEVKVPLRELKMRPE